MKTVRQICNILAQNISFADDLDACKHFFLDLSVLTSNQVSVSIRNTGGLVELLEVAFRKNPRKTFIQLIILFTENEEWQCLDILRNNKSVFNMEFTTLSEMITGLAQRFSTKSDPSFVKRFALDYLVPPLKDTEVAYLMQQMNPFATLIEAAAKISPTLTYRGLEKGLAECYEKTCLDFLRNNETFFFVETPTWKYKKPKITKEGYQETDGKTDDLIRSLRTELDAIKEQNRELAEENEMLREENKRLKKN